MYLFLYKTTNLVNEKIYIGVHKTKKLNDGYLGSGKLLKRAILKYGEENFKKEILEFFDTEEEMFKRESEIINEEFLKRKDVYNLNLGGLGSWSRANNPIFIESKRIAGRQSWEKRSDEQKENDKKRWIEQGTKNFVTYGKSEINSQRAREMQPIGTLAAQSEKARIKRKESFANINHQKGEANSQFGTMWINDGITAKKIKKTEDIPEGWEKGRVSRKSS